MEKKKQEITMMSIEESFEMMQRQGYNPAWCDTPIPVFENRVPAGNPADIGEQCPKGVYYLPAGVVKGNLTYRFAVRGDSMEGANIHDGDELVVRMDSTPQDGDIILAEIDGESTVKAYYEDADGEKWLVPFNDAYEPIHITADKEFTFSGTVIEVSRKNPRTSFRDCQSIVNRSKAKMPTVRVNREQQEYAVRQTAQSVKNSRQWYAVYRALLDADKADGEEIFGRGDFEGFCSFVEQVVGDHPALPNARDLQRMAVQSFDRPVARWREDNAPVGGKRFFEYLAIAKNVARLLAE